MHFAIGAHREFLISFAKVLRPEIEILSRAPFPRSREPILAVIDDILKFLILSAQGPLSLIPLSQRPDLAALKAIDLAYPQVGLVMATDKSRDSEFEGVGIGAETLRRDQFVGAPRARRFDHM